MKVEKKVGKKSCRGGCLLLLEVDAERESLLFLVADNQS